MTTRKLEVNKTYALDCLEGITLLDPNSVDVIVTSPPYNIGIEYRSYKDKRTRSDHLAWLRQIAIVSSVF